MNDRDRILNKTNDGFDIFKHYLGEKCLRPCFANKQRSDTHPSCRLYHQKRSNGYIYYMKDYGDSRWSGDCFHFVSMAEHIDINTDFRKILLFIDKELNLNVIGNNDFVPVERTEPVVEESSEHNTPRIFHPIYQSFTTTELKYWNKYGITEDILQRYHVKSLYYCQFVRQDGSAYQFYSSPEYPMFGYHFDDGAGIKVYWPGSNIRFLYAGMLPKPYVFGMEQLPDNGDNLYITGGEKDVLSLAAHGLHAIAFNSETALFPDDLLPALAQRFKAITILYDCDTCGRRESAKRLEEWRERINITRLILPLAGDKQSKDVSDWFAAGRTVKELVNLSHYYQNNS